MKLVVLCILALIPSFGMSATTKTVPDTKFFEDRITEEKNAVSLVCNGLTARSLSLCLRMKKARELLRPVELTFFRDGVLSDKGKFHSGAIRREMALALYHEATSEWKVLLLDISVDGSEPLLHVRTETDPPFIVERLTGTSFNKMTFRVTQGERRFYPYAAKWLHIPEGVSRTDMVALTEAGTPFIFMRTHPHMDDIHLAKAGLAFLEREVGERLKDFSSHKILSRIREGFSVTDFIKKEDLINLILIEQVDPDHLYGKSWQGFFVDRKPPLSYEANRTVLIDFFANGLDAFRYTCSKQKACGHFQFTNTTYVTRDGKLVTGTYDMVRKHYPEVKLDPIFRRGVESFTNGLHAAILLFDLERSSAQLPSWVKSISSSCRGERPALVVMVAAYNAGGGQASKLATALSKNKKYETLLTGLGTIPWKEILVAPNETRGYILKFLHNSEELFSHSC